MFCEGLDINFGIDPPSSPYPPPYVNDQYTFRSESGRQLGKETFRMAKEKINLDNFYYFHYGSKLPRTKELNRAIT